MRVQALCLLPLSGSLLASASALQWFSFGDSYSATSFDIQGHQPTPEAPMGNSGLDPTGYLNYIWFLTNGYNRTTVLNYNLAYPGATVSQNLSHTKTVDLIQQTKLWKKNYTGPKPKARWNANLTVASYWFGTNDIDLAFSNNLNPDTYLPHVMRVYQAEIETVYKHGVRNFLLMNAGNITRTPTISNNSAYSYEQLVRHARLNLGFNDKFEEMYYTLKNKYHDATFVLYNTFDYFNRVLDSPMEYGFRSAMCVDGSGEQLICPWRNTLHPGRGFNQWMAVDMEATSIRELKEIALTQRYGLK